VNRSACAPCVLLRCPAKLPCPLPKTSPWRSFRPIRIEGLQPKESHGLVMTLFCMCGISTVLTVCIAHMFISPDWIRDSLREEPALKPPKVAPETRFALAMGACCTTDCINYKVPIDGAVCPGRSKTQIRTRSKTT